MKRKLFLCTLTTFWCLSLLPYDQNTVNAEVNQEVTSNDSSKEVIIATLDKKELDELEKFRGKIVDNLKQSDDISKDLPDLMESDENILSNKISQVTSETSVKNVVIITNAPQETYNLNEDTSITFDDTTITTNVFKEEEEKEATEQEEAAFDEETADETILGQLENFVSPKVHAASTKTKVGSMHLTVHDSTLTFYKLFDAHISAEFTYNGTKVTARRTSNYVKGKPGVPFMQITNQHSAVQKPSSKRRIAYQSADVKFGINVFDNGLSFGDAYVKVMVDCNQKGKMLPTYIKH